MLKMGEQKMLSNCNKDVSEIFDKRRNDCNCHLASKLVLRQVLKHIGQFLIYYIAGK